MAYTQSKNDQVEVVYGAFDGTDLTATVPTRIKYPKSITISPIYGADGPDSIEVLAIAEPFTTAAETYALGTEGTVRVERVVELNGYVGDPTEGLEFEVTIRGFGG